MAVKAPAFGERRKALLQDIAIVTAGEFIGKDLGMSVDAVEGDQLGTARRVVVTNNNCTIISDEGNKDDIRTRIQQLKLDLERTESVYDT